jgi:flagellin-like hook-associated protein FlgL
MAKTTKTSAPKSTSKSTAVKSATSSKSMKTTSSRTDVEKLDEVKLGAPTKTAAKAPAKKAVTASAKVATTKTTAKAPAKSTKAAAPTEKSMPTATKSTATSSTAAKSTLKPTATSSTAAKSTVTTPARMAAKPTTSAKKSVTMPTIRLDTVRPELLMLAQKNGWLRAGLTLDVADAQFVYTADKWASIHTLPLASLDDSAKGFTLSGVPTDVEIEYVVKASLSLTKAGEKFDVPGTVWLNNRGHNYTTTVKSTSL